MHQHAILPSQQRKVANSCDILLFVVTLPGQELIVNSLYEARPIGHF